MASDSENKNKSDIASSAVAPEASLPEDDTSATVLPEASLPKLVVCFDIDTLSLHDLHAIALDLNVPDYSEMTKEQLCETLLSL